MLNAFGAWELIDPGRGLARGNVRLPEGFRRARADGYELLLRPEHVEWVAMLGQRFDMVWATMWQERATSQLAPVVGFGQDWPWIDFTAHQAHVTTQRTGVGVGSYKFPGVVATAVDRPMVWIDDDLEASIYEWAAARNAGGIPTLLVQPRPEEGWTSAELAAVEAFADSLDDPAGQT